MIVRIEIEGVEFGYREKEPILGIDSLVIDPGCALGVVGPSGAGKTTLLRLLAGIMVPWSGRLQVGETIVSDLNETGRRAFRNQHVGLVFQDFRLLEYLSLADNIMLPHLVGARGDLKSKLRERVEELVHRLGLASRKSASPGQLSQGEQQRVAIGRALVSSPRLVLADEPTGNLDAGNKLRMRDLLLEYCREQEATLVMVTHDPQLLDEFDRTVDFSGFQRGGHS